MSTLRCRCSSRLSSTSSRARSSSRRCWRSRHPRPHLRRDCMGSPHANVQIFDTAKPTRELKNYLRTAQQRPVCMPKVRGGNATVSTPEYLTPFRFLPGCEYSGVPYFSFPPRGGPGVITPEYLPPFRFLPGRPRFDRASISSLPQGVFVCARARARLDALAAATGHIPRLHAPHEGAPLGLGRLSGVAWPSSASLRIRSGAGVGSPLPRMRSAVRLGVSRKLRLSSVQAGIVAARHKQELRLGSVQAGAAVALQGSELDSVRTPLDF